MRSAALSLIFLAACAASFFAGRASRRSALSPALADTLIVRDTLRDTILLPHVVRIVRVDTLWLPSAPDSVRTPVALPIEQKIYATADYRAVVEGFRPVLTGLELYPKTVFVTRTLPPPRWSVGIQSGFGISPRGPVPYIGIGIQYRLWPRQNQHLR